MNRRSRNPSDLADRTKDEPLSVGKARARAARTRKSSKPLFDLGQVKTGAVKKKRHSQKPAMPKKTKQTTAHQQLKEAAQVQRDSTTEHDSEDETEIDERGDSSAAPLHFEGDPGFEAAFQASRRARRQAQDIENAPRPPHRRGSPTLPNRRAPRGDVLDSELLGDENIEGRTLVAAPSSDTVTARQESAPPTSPSNALTPAPRQRISAITGLPFAGQYRRPEALSGHGDSQFRRRGSPERNSRVTPSTRNRTTEDNNGRAVLTSNSSAASIGLPVPPADRPHQSYYCPSPGGSHYQYTDNSGTPTSVTRPTPSSNSDGTIGANQRAPAQTTTQPAHPGPNVQPVSISPLLQPAEPQARH